VHGRDELDERDDLAVEDFERLRGNDQGDRAAVPDVLAIGYGCGRRVPGLGRPFDLSLNKQVTAPVGRAAK
jgi:hypothetical protein